MEGRAAYLTVIQAVLCTLIGGIGIATSTTVGRSIGIMLCFDCGHV